MSPHDNMVAALKKIVVPALRESGYKGTFPHFRKIGEDVYLLTFQFDRHGGGFVVESAKSEKVGFATYWGKHIPAEKLTAHDLHPNQRKRIQPGNDGSSNSWFRYDSFANCEIIASNALDLIRNEMH